MFSLGNREVFWLAFFIFIGINPGHLRAQTPQKNREKETEVRRILEFIAEQNEDELDFLMLEEQLRYYYDHPLPLNKATSSQLSRLGILTQSQIEALLLFRRTYGDFISVYELQAVPGFSPATARNLAPLVTTEQVLKEKNFPWSEKLREGKHQLFLRHTRTLEEREGFRRNREDGEGGYLGTPGQHYLRYQYSFRRELSYGITAEKDFGEEFFSGNNTEGFDYYSAHAWMGNQGKWKAAALGDYQLQMGQGLVLWSGLAFAKGAQVMSLPRNPRGVLPYRSVNENMFMRGAAGTYQLSDQWRLTGFYSNKNIDGNLDGTDTLSREERFFTSLNANGYHRTAGEIARKDQVNEQLTGSYLEFNQERLKLGASLLHGRYDIPLQPNERLYNRYALKGDRFTNASLDYRYLLGNAYFFGETAFSQQNSSMATLNGVLLSLDPKIDFGLLYRNFPRDYQAPLANAFAETSSTQNESGLYFSAVYRPNYRWELQTYADYFRFPGLRFRVDAPSQGSEYFAQLSHSPKRGTEIYLRYRQQRKPLNESGSEEIVRTPRDYLSNQYRIQLRKQVSETVRLTTRGEYMRHRIGEEAVTKGTLIYQNLAWSPKEAPYSLRARVAVFDVEDFNARIYAYENDVLYAYSVPFFNDQGFRWYAVAKYKFSYHLSAWLRVARTTYRNQEEISSGNAAISGNHRTDVRAQLRFKF